VAVANGNFLIHQYDQINRHLTWLTLAQELAEWRVSLEPFILAATRAIESHEG